jgi:hypothetical protein
VNTTDTWQAFASCHDDPELFFPDGSSHRYDRQINKAKAICQGCPVIRQCATEALTNHIGHGIWGGLDERARRRIHRRHTTRLDNPAFLAGVVEHEIANINHAALQEAYDQRSVKTDKGHTRWIGRSITVTIHREVFTFHQLAFAVGHGRRPDGTVRRACDYDGCVTPTHLTDDQIRRNQPKPKTERTAAEVHAKWAVPTVDGHAVWSGPRQPQLDGRSRSPRRVAFQVLHGYYPAGSITPNCGIQECVKPEHLEDTAMRKARQQANHELPLAAVS